MMSSSLLSEFISKKVNHIIKSTLDSGTVVNINDPSRLTNVRFSSFPFCGVRWFLELPHLVSKSAKKDYAFGYFTRVGTTVHEVTQEALHAVMQAFDAEDVEVLWDWKCKSCKHRHAVLQGTCPTDNCSACGASSGFSREEHQVRHTNKKLGKQAVGHVDTILKVKLTPALARLTGDEYGVIIVDYKTSSVHNVSKKDSDLPYPDNVAQISKYAGVIRKTLPVIGWALVYMPRDIPFRFKVCVGAVTEEDCLAHRRDINKYIRVHTEWSSARTEEEILELYEKRPCRSLADVPAEFKKCDHVKGCCSNATKRQVVSVVSRLKGKLPIVK